MEPVTGGWWRAGLRWPRRGARGSARLRA
jgi:hypothetical protein